MITAVMGVSLLAFGIAVVALMWDWLIELFNYGRRHD